MENLIIVNDRFEEIKKKIGGDGMEKLLVIADFGRTFTKCFVNKKKISTSWAQIRDGEYLGEEYKKMALKYFKKYHPIEVSSNISVEDKVVPLNEWWRKHLELLIEYRLDKDIIKKIIESERVPLREGLGEFLDFLYEKNVPLVIVSQGLGNIYIESLKDISKFHDNIYFISNLLEFNKKGKAVKIKNGVVHPYNKNKIYFEDFDFYDKIKDRKNVLLIGDALEDVGIIEKLDCNNLIKIGFLNEKVDENLDKFKENFDMIILNDSDMGYVNELVWELIG